jgi:hypothetical protein
MQYAASQLTCWLFRGPLFKLLKSNSGRAGGSVAAAGSGWKNGGAEYVFMQKHRQPNWCRKNHSHADASLTNMEKASNIGE